MCQMIRAAFWLITAFGSCGVTSAANMTLKAPPPAPLYHDWAAFYLRAHFGGSLGHQCAEILKFGPWYGIEGAADRAARRPEQYKPIGEGTSSRWENSARSGERRKPEAAINPLVRAMEIRKSSSTFTLAVHPPALDNQ
jgi:hypothetical protein